jgi:aspartyl-tRNA(Asn)/glutamyl-tRNA(Gln) amidotransferase subunit B
VAAEMPALPRALFQRYTKEYGLSEYDAYNITDNKGIALYYEAILAHTKNYKSAANWLMGDIKSYLNEYGIEMDQFPLKPLVIAELIHLIEEGKVSTTVASQRIFPALFESSETPLQIAERLNLIQNSDEDALKGFIEKVFELNPDEVTRYRAGEKQLTGFFMGQLMKVSQGKADPKLANGLLRQMLDA